MVWEAARAVKIPIIGLGGIATPEDAVEFLLAGATAVQVGTASYADPRATERIAQGLEQWCSRHHVARVAELIGGLDVSPLPGPVAAPVQPAPAAVAESEASDTADVKTPH